ncbi:sensor histidine kinase [Candidatus Riflebacteria bacterium]
MTFPQTFRLLTVFRTPLTILSSSLGILKSSLKEIQDGQPLARIFNMATSAQLRLYHRFEDILDLDNYKTGDLSFVSREFSLHDAIAEARKAVRHDIKNNVTFINSVPEDLKVMQDKKIVTQIFAKVIENSIKLTVEGKISVDSTITESGFSTSIKDTGPGIPPEMQDRVGKSFQTGDKLFYHKEGMGLGLAITFQAVKFLKGAIKIESETEGDNHGTLIKIDIPDTAKRDAS